MGKREGERDREIERVERSKGVVVGMFCATADNAERGKSGEGGIRRREGSENQK